MSGLLISSLSRRLVLAVTTASKALRNFIGLLKDDKIENNDKVIDINKDEEEGEETDESPCSRSNKHKVI